MSDGYLVSLLFEGRKKLGSHAPQEWFSSEYGPRDRPAPEISLPVSQKSDKLHYAPTASLDSPSAQWYLSSAGKDKQAKACGEAFSLTAQRSDEDSFGEMLSRPNCSLSRYAEQSTASCNGAPFLQQAEFSSSANLNAVQSDTQLSERLTSCLQISDDCNLQRQEEQFFELGYCGRKIAEDSSLLFENHTGADANSILHPCCFSTTPKIWRDHSDKESAAKSHPAAPIAKVTEKTTCSSLLPPSGNKLHEPESFFRDTASGCSTQVVEPVYIKDGSQKHPQWHPSAVSHLSSQAGDVRRSMPTKISARLSPHTPINATHAQDGHESKYSDLESSFYLSPVSSENVSWVPEPLSLSKIPNGSRHQLCFKRTGCTDDGCVTVECGEASDAAAWASASTTIDTAWSPDETCGRSDCMSSDTCYLELAPGNALESDEDPKHGYITGSQAQDDVANQSSAKITAFSVRPTSRCAGPGSLCSFSSYCTPRHLAAAAVSVPARLCRRLKLIPPLQCRVQSSPFTEEPTTEADMVSSWTSSKSRRCATLSGTKSVEKCPTSAVMALSTSPELLHLPQNVKIDSSSNVEQPMEPTAQVMYHADDAPTCGLYGSSVPRRSVPLVTIPCIQGALAVRHQIHPTAASSSGAPCATRDQTFPQRYNSKSIASCQESGSLQCNRSASLSKQLKSLPLSLEGARLTAATAVERATAVPIPTRTRQMRCTVCSASHLALSASDSPAKCKNTVTCCSLLKDSHECFSAHQPFSMGVHSKKQLNMHSDNISCWVVGMESCHSSFAGPWCFAQAATNGRHNSKLACVVNSEQQNFGSGVPPRRRADVVGLGITLGTGSAEGDQLMSERGLLQYLHISASIRHIAHEFQRIMGSACLTAKRFGDGTSVYDSPTERDCSGCSVATNCKGFGDGSNRLPFVESYSEYGSVSTSVCDARASSCDEHRTNLLDKVDFLEQDVPGDKAPTNSDVAASTNVSVLERSSVPRKEVTDISHTGFNIVIDDNVYNSTSHHDAGKERRTAECCTHNGSPNHHFSRCDAACWTEIVLFIETILCLQARQRRRTGRRGILCHPGRHPAATRIPCEISSAEQQESSYITENQSSFFPPNNVLPRADEEDNSFCFSPSGISRASFTSAYWIVFLAFWIERRLHCIAAETDAPWLLDQFCVCYSHSKSQPPSSRTGAGNQYHVAETGRQDVSTTPVSTTSNWMYPSLSGSTKHSISAANRDVVGVTRSTRERDRTLPLASIGIPLKSFTRNESRFCLNSALCDQHSSVGAATTRCSSLDLQDGNTAKDAALRNGCKASVSRCEDCFSNGKNEYHAFSMNAKKPSACSNCCGASCKTPETFNDNDLPVPSAEDSPEHSFWGPQIDVLRRFLLLCFCAWSWVEDEATTTGSMVAIIQHIWWCTNAQITLGLRHNAAQRRSSPPYSVAPSSSSSRPEHAGPSGRPASSIAGKAGGLKVRLCEAVAVTSRGRFFPHYYNVNCPMAIPPPTETQEQKLTESRSQLLSRNNSSKFNEIDYYAEYLALPTSCSTSDFEAQVFVLMKALGYRFSASPAVLSERSLRWCHSLRKGTCCGKQLLYINAMEDNIS